MPTAGGDAWMMLVRPRTRPPVTPPLRKGFGTRLIERQLARELRGSVELTYATEGVTCTIKAPLVETATVSPPGLAQALTANGVRDES